VSPTPAKVLVLSGARGDTRRYRAFNLYQQLCLAGLNCVLSDITDPALLRHAAASRLVFIHRAAYNSFVRKIIEQVHANQGAVLFDTDDLIFDQAAFNWIDSPDFSDPIREKMYREHLDLQRKSLELADAVLVSTGYLAQQVNRLGKPVWVHRNGFSLELGALSESAWRQRRINPERVVIGYASGTPTHNRDFALIQPVLKSILSRFPQAELWLLGLVEPKSEWGSVASQIRTLPLVPWRALPAVLAQLDINLAPLVEDNPFSQSKSEIKYMEAGLVGVATIASPTDAFRFAIQTGQNGLLASSQEQWSAALAGLIENSTLRHSIGETARQTILAQYNPALRAQQLRQLLSEINQGRDAAGQIDLPDLPAALPAAPAQYAIPASRELHPTLLELGAYYMRLGDFRRLAAMTWVQIRRWFAPLFPF
jgi:glycosyltransferase involved in cell wall biosynthesis